MYYYRNRYYSPQTGRFISEDPIGWASGQTNAYAYVGGNPVSLTDPLGFWSVSVGGYVGIGGQVTVYGDGSTITGYGGRGGFGLGGGVSYDPDGAVPSQSAIGSSVTVGGFAEADANWGPITGSGTYSRGMEVSQSGSSGLPGFGWKPYRGLGGSVTGSFPGDSFKGSACAAVGIEVTTTRGK